MTPCTISHDRLLAALELKSLGIEDDDFPKRADAVPSVYRMQLRHTLLSLARRAHLAVAAHELTGLPESEISQKSTVELLLLLDQKRANLSPAEASRIRYWT
jgi:hypothetical protein